MKKITHILTIILAITIIAAGAIAQDNEFQGTIDSDWDNPGNWSTDKVPPTLVVQKITIAANCVVSNSVDYTFEQGSTLRINAGYALTNNGTGIWTMGGTIDGAGTYIAALDHNGSIEPGDNVSTWTCGDELEYGGQSYSTVQIGGQCWMAENLNIGAMITGTTNMTDNSIIEKYCYNNDPANCTTYGGLYQLDEMMQYTTMEGAQGISPTGWHLPSDDEIKTLEMSLGMTQAEANMTGLRGTDQGSQLAGNEPLWTNGSLDQNGAGTPPFGTSGFDALPGGYRTTSGNFSNLSLSARLWSSSKSGGNAWFRYLYYYSPEVYRFTNLKAHGFSVRCLRD